MSKKKPAPVPQARKTQPPVPVKKQTAKPVRAKGFSALANGHWQVAALAAVLGILLYVNTFGHQYVLDDYSAIKDNWVTKGGLKNLGIIFSTEYRFGMWNSPGSLYRPLPLAMFALEWSLMPDNPFIFHFINVLLYGLTGWVLWTTWRRILIAHPPALTALAVLFFMAHPVHTEVVANIKSRDEILALLLCTSTLYALWKHFEHNSNGWLTAAVLAFGAALFAKESSITFLAIFPLTLWFFSHQNTEKILRVSALMLIPAAVFFFVRYKVLAAQGPFKEEFSALDNLIVGAKNPAERFATTFMMCGRYLYALLIPHPLVSDLGFPQYKPVGFGDWRALTGFAAMTGMGVWAVLSLRRKHFLSFAVLFFLVTFSIASNIVMVIGTSYGERLLYAPALGLAFAAAFLFVKIFKINDLESVWNPNGKGVLLWSVAGAIMLIYSFLTIQRNTAWYNSDSLYEADIVHSPNCAKLNYHRGLEMVQKGLDEKTGEQKDSTWILKGIESYTKAMSLYPGYHDAFGSRGVAHLKLRHYAQAEADFLEALKYRPNDAKSYSNLGFIYMLQQKPEKAQEVYQKALQYDPRYVDARRNLGAVLAMQKKFPEAIQQWTEGLKYDPNNYTLLFYIGSAYRDMGRLDQAQPWFDRAKAAEGKQERR